MPFPVVLDANVLFPFLLRDTLLRAAHAGLYQAYWSEEILDEARRNLVSTGTITPSQAERLFKQIRLAFPESLVTGYEFLVDAMPNHPKDRHVAAIAVKAGAQVIVTCNLRDFASVPDGIEAQSPDEFLCNLIDLAPPVLVDIVRQQTADMKSPPYTLENVLRGLSKVVPDFVAELCEHLV
jgi:predicted nucleic acid-binding protein